MKRIAVVVLSLAGCLPDMPVNNELPPNATPRQIFDLTVAPALDGQCASCHVGLETSATNMFLGQQHTSDSYYAGVTNDRAINGGFSPAAASLLTKGKHEGPAWDQADHDAISTWLLAEAAARPDPNPMPSPNPPPPGATGPTNALDAEKQWATCMGVAISEYQTTKAYAIADLQTDNNGPCYSCHEPGGAGGAYWGRANNYLTMLQKWQEQVFINGAFLPELQSDNTFRMQVANGKICAKSTEKSDGRGNHPSFNCEGSADGVVVLDALGAFVTATQQKIDSGACPAPYDFLPPQ